MIATQECPYPHELEIVDDLLVVLDQDGNGHDCHELGSGYRAAQRQVQKWTAEYTFDVAEVYNLLDEYFLQTN